MENREHVVNVSYALSFARHLGFLVALSIAFFTLAGYLGDMYLGTGHLLLALGVLVGVASSGVAAYFLLKPLIHHKNKK